MTFVVNESCIRCKIMDCVEVCPVDCFYEGENMLVIHPDECIDCGVCEPECPYDAIKADTEICSSAPMVAIAVTSCGRSSRSCTRSRANFRQTRRAPWTRVFPADDEALPLC